MTRQGYGESTRKIILMGEHAVTSDQPAITVPFNTGKIRVLIESLDEGNYSSITSNIYGGMLYDAPEHLKSIVSRFVEKNGVKEPLSVKIQTNLPPSRGLGSSAAITVAFVHANYDLMDQPLDDKALIKEANWAGQIAHGKPSSIDTQTIVSNKPVWSKQGQTETLKSLKLNGYMVVTDTGVRDPTKQAVEGVHTPCESDEYMKYIERTGTLVHSASGSTEQYDFHHLADIFSACQEGLRHLTVSHDKIEKLLQVGEGHGAIAGKLTDRGRGGSVFLLAENLETTKTIVAAIEKAGAAYTWIEHLGG